ncbi:MAG TPA: transcription elongation factor GreA [Candidatus Brocadiia bacterium]|nr:transcription elongation factor GreA [Planctomycetota bacterium]MDO8094152.1 transcription elongation factor GreA [Candidatus Brocadiales bacterium]
MRITKKGREKLEAELKALKDKRQHISQAIGDARAFGDLRENAEYHAAREAQALNEAKIRQLEDKLARAILVDESKLPDGVIVILSNVKLRDLDSGDIEEYSLVGEGHSDPHRGKILVTSPLAQGLLGHKRGDKVSIEVPAGKLNYEILEISRSVDG